MTQNQNQNPRENEDNTLTIEINGFAPEDKSHLRSHNDAAECLDFQQTAEQLWKGGRDAGLQEFFDEDDEDSIPLHFNYLEIASWEKPACEQVQHLDEIAWNLVLALGKYNTSSSQEKDFSWEEVRQNPLSLTSLPSHTEHERASLQILKMSFGEKGETVIGQFLQTHWTPFTEWMEQEVVPLAENTAPGNEEVGEFLEVNPPQNESFPLDRNPEATSKEEKSLVDRLFDGGITLFEKIKENPKGALFTALAGWAIYHFLPEKGKGIIRKTMGGIGVAGLLGGAAAFLSGGIENARAWLNKHWSKATSFLGGIRDFLPDWAQKLLDAKEKAEEMIGNAKKEYDDFLKKHPDLAQVLPEDLGNFLGILGISAASGLTLKKLLGNSNSQGRTALLKRIFQKAFSLRLLTPVALVGGIWLFLFERESAAKEMNELKESGWFRAFQNATGSWGTEALAKIQEGSSDALEYFGLSGEEEVSFENREEFLQALQDLGKKSQEQTGREKQEDKRAEELQAEISEGIQALRSLEKGQSAGVDIQRVFFLAQKSGLETEIQEIGSGDRGRFQITLEGIPFPLLKEDPREHGFSENIDETLEAGRAIWEEHSTPLLAAWGQFLRHTDVGGTDVGTAEYRDQLWGKIIWHVKKDFQESSIAEMGTQALLGLVTVKILFSGLKKIRKAKALKTLLSLLASKKGLYGLLAGGVATAWHLGKEGNLSPTLVASFSEAMGETKRFSGSIWNSEQSVKAREYLGEQWTDLLTLFGIRGALHEVSEEDQGKIIISLQDLEHSEKLKDNVLFQKARERLLEKTEQGRIIDTAALGELAMLAERAGGGVQVNGGNHKNYILQIEYITFPAFSENPYPIKVASEEKSSLQTRFLVHQLETLEGRFRDNISSDHRLYLPAANIVQEMRESVEKKGYSAYVAEKEQDFLIRLMGIPGVKVKMNGNDQTRVITLESRITGKKEKSVSLPQSGITPEAFFQLRKEMKTEGLLAEFLENIEWLGGETEDFYLEQAADYAIEHAAPDSELFVLAQNLKSNLTRGFDTGTMEFLLEATQETVF